MSHHADVIRSPDDGALDALCARLSDAARKRPPHAWPAEELADCGRSGVFEWFLPESWEGQNWSDSDVIRGYLKLSAACLTTTFIITQLTGACRRIAASDAEPKKRELLPQLVTGDAYATVGISHLTTSRRHLKTPVLRADASGDSFILDGFSPWVTGAPHAQAVVTGATLPDNRQIIVALPMDLDGVSVPQPETLIGLSGSLTGRVDMSKVLVPHECLLAGPVENVMSLGVGAKSGGLQTSTLAVGLASAAIAFLENEAEARSDLASPGSHFRQEHHELESRLIAMADGDADCTHEQLRVDANSLVLRATQAALAAAKGTGYVVGHPAGRWCQEALFFLVWSCPQPVMAANLCEFAGITD